MTLDGGIGSFLESTDAPDQLAALTRLPAGLWVGLFGVVAVCALAFSTLWLVRW